jgi:arylsulfatase A-like enzyme
VEKADSALGTVLDAAELDSTVVAYTTDHGDGLGEHGLPYKGAFMYEELLHIPLVIAGPKAAIGRGERNDMVTQTDLAPTLASMAGVAWPAPVDGFDLTKKKNARDALLLEYYGQQHLVNPIRTIRTVRWKLNWYDSGNKELYDLREDPHELRNLAGDSGARTVQQDLEKRLTAWRPPMTELEKKAPEYSSRKP